MTTTDEQTYVELFVRRNGRQVVARPVVLSVGDLVLDPFNPQRPVVSAELPGEFVVFLIGMRINKPWKVHKWLPVFLAMPRMLKELSANRDLGFLGYTFTTKLIVQYWRSYQHLEAFARDPSRAHWPAWIDFNRRIKGARGDVGIWHETYLVPAGSYETMYGNMPAFGLARAGTHMPAGRHSTAASRAGRQIQEPAPPQIF